MKFRGLLQSHYIHKFYDTGYQQLLLYNEGDIAAMITCHENENNSVLHSLLALGTRRS